MPPTPKSLRPQTMMETFNLIKTPGSALAKYFPARRNEGVGQNVVYDVLEWANRLMPAVARDARAPKRVMQKRSQVALEGITFKEALPLSPLEMRDLLAPGSLTENQEAEMVGRAIRQMRLDHDNTLEFLRGQWMTGGALVDSSNAVPGAADGTVYLRPEGHAIDSPLSVALGFTATHIDAAVPVSWATTTTKIRADLDAARVVIAGDSGVDARRVILNSTTMGYLYACAGFTDSDTAVDRLIFNGKLEEFWGFKFDVIDEAFPITTDLFNDTAGTQKVIPDNVVVLTTDDNMAAGRAMIECQPTDLEAPSGHRGAYFWNDIDTEHPHAPTPGMETTVIPMLQNPDGTYIFTSVITAG